MGYFDRVDVDEYQQFQAEVRKKLDVLEVEVQSKITDSEQAARAAAVNAVASEGKIALMANSIEESLGEIERYKESALLDLEKFRQEKEILTERNSELLAAIQSTQELYSQIADRKSKIDSSATEISKKVAEITAYLEQSKGLPDSVDEAQGLLGQCTSLADSVKSILDHCVKKKVDVDELYRSIYGEDVKDTKGNLEHVDGFKDHLEHAYSSIKEKISQLETELKVVLDGVTQRHEVRLAEQRGVFDQLVANSELRITAVNDQLTGLLPGAMAEGLSAAYEKKKDDEVKSLQQFEGNFRMAILAMVLTASIPFAVDIYLLAGQGKDLVQVIKDTPSLIIAILPLYFPILWLAYSSSKKVNLSKRLIEEYTHKAVLGKTFSGLSNQIETLQHQSEIKDELRTRLLFNVLQVSAENPGKLITDYNKSDHPLMDALEKSARLSDSIEVLSKIPGFSALAKKLAQKSDEIFDAQANKVQSGLNIQAAMKVSGGGEPKEEKV